MQDTIPSIVPNDIDKHVTHHYADNHGVQIHYASIGKGPLIVMIHGFRTYHGSITKKGSKYLRWIMLEWLHAHIRNDKNSNVTQFYHRLSKKKGNSKAAVAAASKLVKVVYWIMKEKRTYDNHHG